MLGLVPLRLTPAADPAFRPNGVPGTLLLGKAGKEAIESAMPDAPSPFRFTLSKWSTAEWGGSTRVRLDEARGEVEVVVFVRC